MRILSTAPARTSVGLLRAQRSCSARVMPLLSSPLLRPHEPGLLPHQTTPRPASTLARSASCQALPKSGIDDFRILQRCTLLQLAAMSPNHHRMHVSCPTLTQALNNNAQIFSFCPTATHSLDRTEDPFSSNGTHAPHAARPATPPEYPGSGRATERDAGHLRGKQISKIIGQAAARRRPAAITSYQGNASRLMTSASPTNPSPSSRCCHSLITEPPPG